MNRLAIATAALLLSAGFAAAQGDAPAAAPGAGSAPTAEAPADAAAAAKPRVRHGGPDGMRGHGRKMHPHARGHHGMMRASKGAMFVFTAPGEGRIMIKCADEDSTQACADAVKPLLEMMLNAGGE